MNFVLLVIYMYVGLSTGTPYKKYLCQNAWAELRDPNTRMLKVSFGWLKPTYDTSTRKMVPITG